MNVTFIPHEHEWSEWTTVMPSTCTFPGIEKRTCTCGAEETQSLQLDNDAHAWGEWYTSKEPTVNEEGELRRVCRNDPNHVETQPVPRIDPPAGDEPSGNNNGGSSFWDLWQRIIRWFRQIFAVIRGWFGG